MFRVMRLCALALIALALVTSPVTAQTEEVVTDAPSDVKTPDLPPLPVLEIPLYVGTTRADFGVYEGENINVAAEKFGEEYSLSPEDLATLKAEVTRRLISITDAVNANRERSADAKQPLFEVPVSLESGEVARLRLYEGDDLFDAVKKFAETQNIPEDFVPHLFEEVKKKITKERAAGAEFGDNQIVFDIPVTFDGETEHRVVLREGDVVQEVVEKMADDLELEEDVKANLLASVLQRVKDTAIAADEAEAASRAEAGESPVYEIKVQRGEDSLPLRLYEGDVLERAVAAFVARHGFDESAVPLIVKGAIETIQRARAEAQPEPARDEQGRLAVVTLAVSMDVPAEASDDDSEETSGSSDAETSEASSEAPKPAKVSHLPPITLYEGQTPEEVATAYCEANGLDLEEVGPRLADVLRKGVAKRQEAERAAAKEEDTAAAEATIPEVKGDAGNTESTEEEEEEKEKEEKEEEKEKEETAAAETAGTSVAA